MLCSFHLTGCQIENQLFFFVLFSVVSRTTIEWENVDTYEGFVRPAHIINPRSGLLASISSLLAFDNSGIQLRILREQSDFVWFK